MTRKADDRIADILDACAELAELVAMRPSSDVPSWVLTRAAERLLEMIGEAATALPAAGRAAHPDVPWREIMRLRIVLAHHYQRVDPQQVWTIAERDIPRLATALRSRTPPVSP